MKATKQETIEQASEYHAHNYFDVHETNNYEALKQGFEAGAKWQQEQDENKFSEEELKYAYAEGAATVARYYDNHPFIDKNEWFEQFKNK